MRLCSCFPKMRIKMWMRQLGVILLSVTVLAVGICRFPFRVVGPVSLILAIGMTSVGLFGIATAFWPKTPVVMALLISEAALIVVDAVDLSLILFANAWRFENSAYWLIPELLLLSTATAFTYYFYHSPREIKRGYSSLHYKNKPQTSSPNESTHLID